LASNGVAWSMRLRMTIGPWLRRPVAMPLPEVMRVVSTLDEKYTHSISPSCPFCVAAPSIAVPFAVRARNTSGAPPYGTSGNVVPGSSTIGATPLVGSAARRGRLRRRGLPAAPQFAAAAGCPSADAHISA
jgi:hypothetical protein